MSDFGSVLEVTSKNLKQSDISEISTLIKNYFEEKGIKNEVGEDYQSEEVLLNLENGSAQFILTEYYFSGDETEDDELYEFVEDVEKNIVEELIASLKITFSTGFEFKYYIDNW